MVFKLFYISVTGSSLKPTDIVKYKMISIFVIPMFVIIALVPINPKHRDITVRVILIIFDQLPSYK